MSFQATEWARSLPLDSLSAKFTLMTIGSYADTDGVCFPSLTRLAGDTVQSKDSVRRRVRELEQLGLVQRLARWASPDGRIVVTKIADDQKRPDGYRQTSDELRLMLDVSPAELRRRLTELHPERPPPAIETDDEAADEAPATSPLPGGEGSNLPGGGWHSSAMPGVAEPCDPLKQNSKSSAEETPKSPAGAGDVIEAAPAAAGSDPPSPITDVRPWLHADSWQRFEDAWREPILHQQLCRQLWGGLSDEDRGFLIGKVAPGYVAWRKAQRTPPTVCNAQKLLREREAWNSYARFAPDSAAAAPKQSLVFAEINSLEGRAWYALIEIGSQTHDRAEALGAFGYMVPAELPPAVALLAGVKTRAKEWPLYPIGSGECAAWRQFVVKHLGKSPRLRRDESGTEGIRAPWRWPPRKDGSRSDDQPSEADE